MIFKEMDIDLQGLWKPFNHFFRATGYANADYTYTPPLRRMYDCLASYNGHPLYMRLHNILTLHGKGDYYITHEKQDYGNPAWDKERVDVVVEIDKNGKSRFNWELVDTIYDIIIGHGMRPIVETVYMPACISRENDNYYLPKDFSQWEDVIAAFAKHWINRYGIEEVRKWYFEIWNEPDNHEEWNRDPASFFALYDYFEYALHQIDPYLKCGGPAVKQWEDGQRIFAAFLEHCAHGVNFRTGTYGSRLDFISVHSKGGHPELVGPSIDYMFNPLREFITVMKQFKEFENTEFFNDESDIVWEGNMGISHKSWLNFRNTHYASAFTAKMIYTYCSVIEDELKVNLQIVDSDNCHLTWEKSFFSGNRSQFTPLGAAPCTDIIRKPIFNIFPLLAKLGNERFVPVSTDEEFGKKYGLLATRDNEGSYAFLLWNSEDGLVQDVNERPLRLTLKNLDPAGVYDTLHFRIDDAHSNAYEAWRRMGKPYPLSPEQICTLREHEGLELLEAPVSVAGKKEYEIICTLPMHAVSLIQLVKRIPLSKRAKETAVSGKPALILEEGILGNKQVFIRWAFSKRRDIAGYRVFRKKEGENPVCINTSEKTQCSYYVDMRVENGFAYAYAISAVYADGTESVVSPEQTIRIE